MTKILEDRNNEPRGLSPVPRIGLNADDAAKAIGVSKRQLFAIKDSGELPFITIGPQTFLFLPEDLKSWLNKKKQTNAPGGQHG
jgi:hypothetical protein